jgi:hypothetical protein
MRMTGGWGGVTGAGGGAICRPAGACGVTDTTRTPAGAWGATETTRKPVGALGAAGRC